MTLQASGEISLSDLQTEFGGSNPISVSEYYKGGTYVPSTVATTASAGSLSWSETGGSSGWTSPVFWRYYETGVGHLPTINPNSTTLYFHAFWTDGGWTSGNSTVDTYFTIDTTGSYVATVGGYNTGATRSMTVYVNGSSQGSSSYGDVSFSATAGDTIRIYSVMNTIGNYNEHRVDVTPRAQSATVNTTVPTSGEVSLTDYYSGQKTY